MTPEPSLATAVRSGPLSSPAPISIGHFAKAVRIMTAIAGTLDIIAAHLHIWAVRGRFPTQVFKGIAGGAFGALLEHSTLRIHRQNYRQILDGKSGIHV